MIPREILEAIASAAAALLAAAWALTIVQSIREGRRNRRSRRIALRRLEESFHPEPMRVVERLEREQAATTLARVTEASRGPEVDR